MIYVNTEEMARIEKTARKRFKIKVEETLELSGKALSDFVYYKIKPKKVLILYGKWNIGAAGLVAARYLMGKGVKVSIVRASRRGKKLVRARLKTLRRMKVVEEKNVKKADVIIDALLGYGFKRMPWGKYSDLIDQANSLRSKGVKIVSLDVPSGINADTGESYGNFIRANYTLALALPKKAMEKSSRGFGVVYLVDIGIPKTVYDYLNIKYEDYFKNEGIVKLQ